MKLVPMASLFLLLTLVSGRELRVDSGSWLLLSTFAMSCSGLGVLMGRLAEKRRPSA